MKAIIFYAVPPKEGAPQRRIFRLHSITLLWRRFYKEEDLKDAEERYKTTDGENADRYGGSRTVRARGDRTA